MTTTIRQLLSAALILVGLVLAIAMLAVLLGVPGLVLGIAAAMILVGILIDDPGPTEIVPVTNPRRTPR